MGLPGGGGHSRGQRGTAAVAAGEAEWRRRRNKKRRAGKEQSSAAARGRQAGPGVASPETAAKSHSTQARQAAPRAIANALSSIPPSKRRDLQTISPLRPLHPDPRHPLRCLLLAVQPLSTASRHNLLASILSEPVAIPPHPSASPTPHRWKPRLGFDGSALQTPFLQIIRRGY